MKHKKEKSNKHKDSSNRRSSRRKKGKPSADGLRERLLAFLKEHPAEDFSVKRLCKELDLHSHNHKKQLIDLLDNIEEEGLIGHSKQYRLRIPLEEQAQAEASQPEAQAPEAPQEPLREVRMADKPRQERKERRKKDVNEETSAPVAIGPDTLVGKVDFVNPKFAFIIVEGQDKDIWVSEQNLRHALDGDTVLVRTWKGGRRNRIEGEVLQIQQRATMSFVGHLEMSDKYAFVITSGRKMHYDIFVPKDQINGAQNGDKVIVEITRWKERDRKPNGRITKVLGKAGENDTEIHAIMFEYGLPYSFPPEVDAQSETLPDTVQPQDMEGRKEFRHITTFTIDPVTAKDFDDALSIRRMKNGHWEIGVHIADVTHYVRPGTLLEEEARKRATSVYLVDRTIPMLPEKISNGLCSLNPHVDRLAFSAVFEMDEQAKVHRQWFGRTVIHSDRRFSYEEAQERIESGEGDFAEEIITLNELAKKLKTERFAQGAISFESVELRFELDEKGKPIGLFPKVRKDAHKMIEEFMLLANKRVAEYVHRKREDGKPVTMVYRVHDSPDPEKVVQLTTFLKRFGYELQETEGKGLARSLNLLTQEVEGRPEQNLIESQAVRSMAKARYTTDPEGHYGLAFAHYSHFTSPIRRYPDMMAHRLLQHYIDKGRSVNAQEYEELCRHSSEMEKRAADAERASVKFKQVEFMSQFIDKDLDGFVSGVTEWGIYVEIKEYRCEGMVRLASMEDDYYRFDEEERAVIGEKYKRTYRLGDDVRVLVKAANIEKRTLDFEMLT